MERVLAVELAQHVQKQVLVRGWLNNLRAMGKINFLLVRDRSGLIQVVVQDREELKKISTLQPGSLLIIQGTVHANAQAGLGVELIDPKIEVEISIKEVPPVEYYKPQIP